MKRIIFSLIILTFLITACDNVDLSKVSAEDVNKVIVCPDKYIRFGSSCCLDANDNKICDKDETQITVEDEKEAPDESPVGETSPEEVTSKDFSVEIDDIKDVITLDELAEYNITIKNNMDEDKKFHIKSRDYPFWDIYTKPLQNPIEVTVAPGQSESVTIYVDPLHIISIGTVDVNVEISLVDSEENVIETIKLRVTIIGEED